MKLLLILVLLLSNYSHAGEVSIGLSTTHIFSNTWRDEEGKSHPYNEDSNLVSYTNNNGIGIAVFNNSYGDDSVLAYRTFSVPYIAYRQLSLSYGASIGIVTGYQAKGGAGINPVLSPHFRVSYKVHTLHISLFSGFAIVTVYSYKFD